MVLSLVLLLFCCYYELLPELPAAAGSCEDVILGPYPPPVEDEFTKDGLLLFYIAAAVFYLVVADIEEGYPWTRRL